jgi:hypothetical protein
MRSGVVDEPSVSGSFGEGATAANIPEKISDANERWDLDTRNVNSSGEERNRSPDGSEKWFSSVVEVEAIAARWRFRERGIGSADDTRDRQIHSSSFYTNCGQSLRVKVVRLCLVGGDIRTLVTRLRKSQDMRAWSRACTETRWVDWR